MFSAQQTNKNPMNATKSASTYLCVNNEATIVQARCLSMCLHTNKHKTCLKSSFKIDLQLYVENLLTFPRAARRVAILCFSIQRSQIRRYQKLVQSQQQSRVSSPSIHLFCCSRIPHLLSKSVHKQKYMHQEQKGVIDNVALKSSQPAI